jgi:hypothetical protein
VVAEKAERFCHSLFDGVPGEFGGLVRGDCPELDVYAFQVQDAFGSERAGNGIQAGHFPVAGKSSFGIFQAAAVSPVVDAVPERVHGIRELVEIAARKAMAAIL